MKKIFLSLAVIVMAICANAQTNQYFWYQGNLMLGTQIAQIDSVTFGDGESTDTLHILLPRTIIKTVHDTLYITIHDTVCPDNIHEGALAGEFSVSPTKKVRFSKGNLQYQASTSTWRFAENQYEYIGTANNNVSQSYSGWIDVFGFGTSGWAGSDATYYQPWDTQRIASEGWTGGYLKHDMTNEYSDTDWGVFNKISNGGNVAKAWRTLSQTEWEYILTHYKWTIANVNGTRGLMIVLDGISQISDISINYPSYTTQTNGNAHNAKYYSLSVTNMNNFTTEQFAQLQDMGIVFLPCGGYRYPSSMFNVGTFGNYWTSDNGLNIWFTSSVLYYYSGAEHWAGLQVRLVQDVEE